MSNEWTNGAAPEDADRLGRSLTFRQLAAQWQQLAESHENEVAQLYAENQTLKAQSKEMNCQKEMQFLSQLVAELDRRSIPRAADLVAQRMREIKAAKGPMETKEGLSPVNPDNEPPANQDVSLQDDGKRAWALNDADQIKSKVRENLLKNDAYNVFDYYHEAGVAQRISKSTGFDYITLAIIALNAIWMGYDTDFNTSPALMEAEYQFIIVEHFFCTYFSVELLIRFLAFRQKKFCLRDAWFVFDSILVLLMVMETWIFAIFFNGENPFGDNTAILRLFRLLRLTRLVKMLNSFPQLLILVRGMVTALKSVIYVIVLLVGITYVFAIACTQLSVDNKVIHERYFHGVALSMYSLTVYATFLDNLADFLNDIKRESTVILIVASVYIFLSALTVMNMLIGILCEVIGAVARTEKEELLTGQVKTEMRRVLQDLDSDGNGMMSYQEMKGILSHAQAIKALKAVDVDPVGLIDFAEIFFLDEQGNSIEITFERFMELVLDLRATNTATLKDIMNLGKQLNSKHSILQTSLRAVQERLGDTPQKGVVSREN